MDIHPVCNPKYMLEKHITVPMINPHNTALIYDRETNAFVSNSAKDGSNKAHTSITVK
jgi:hypothetical protein